MSRLIFDVGANVGQSAIQFLNAGAERVICVEPVLDALLRIPNDYRIVRIHAAAWDEACVKPIYPAINELGWSTLVPDAWGKTKPTVQWGKPEPVVCIPLSVLAKEYGTPDTVKIDVEGVELEVIHGMDFKPRKVIFEFCNVYMDNAERCLTALCRKGFQRACYTDPKLQVDIEPELAIVDCMLNLRSHNPRSGNIIVT